MAKNRYTRALKVLKNSQVEEKLQLLEALPTNNTTGMYVIEPASETTETETLLPRAADFTQDGDGAEGYSGNDTTGLFLTDGTILTIEPPGDTSYVLGPMASMWYAWGNFTQIGYIRQSDRKMVNLARITGELGNWDGESNFTSYGQLTLEQAVWFRDTPKLNDADNDTPNYRAFYPGPPSNVADEYGRYLCVITGTPKPTDRTITTRVPDTMGNPTDAGFPWLPDILRNLPDKLKDFVDDIVKDGVDFFDDLLDIVTPENAEELADDKVGEDLAKDPTLTNKELDKLVDTYEKAKDNIKDYYGPAFGDDKTANRERYKPTTYDYDPKDPKKSKTPEVPPGGAMVKTGDGYTILNANQLARYRAGGGEAAINSGKSFQDVMTQGSINIQNKPKLTTSNAELQRLMSKPPGSHTPAERQKLLDAGLDDFVKGGMKGTDIIGDAVTLIGSYAIVKGLLGLGVAGVTKLGLTATGVTLGQQAKETYIDKANDSGQYNKQLGGKLVTSIISGQPQEIELTPAAKKDQINSVDPEQFAQALQIGPAQKPSANSTVNPTQKRPILTGGWGAQGGSEVSYDPKTDTLTITSEKMLRTGQPGDKFDITQGGQVSGGQVVDPGRQTAFGDIPEPTDAEVSKITQDVLNNVPIARDIINTLVPGAPFTVPGDFNVETGQREPDKTYETPYEYLQGNPKAMKNFSDNISKSANDLAKGAVQGTASNTVALRKVLTNLGFPQSEVEKTGGGYGQVYSQTSYKGNQIPAELRNIINNKTGRTQESVTRRLLSPHRILKEQPTSAGSITAHTPQGDVTVNIPSADPQPSTDPQPYPDPGDPPKPQPYRPEQPTNYSKDRLGLLQSFKSPFSVAGYVGGMALEDIQKMVQGTSLSYVTIVRLINDKRRYRLEVNEVHEEYFRVGDIEHALTGRLLNEASIAIDAKDYSRVYYLIDEVDRSWARKRAVAYKLEAAVERQSSTTKMLGDYIKSGKLNDPDPYGFGNPNIPGERPENVKDAQIKATLEELKKAQTDAEKSALLNKLKAMGMAALLAGIAVLGVAILAKPAIVASIGLATARLILKAFSASKNILRSKPPVKPPSPKPPTPTPTPALSQTLKQGADAALSKLSKLRADDPAAGRLWDRIHTAQKNRNAKALKNALDAFDDFLGGPDVGTSKGFFNSYIPRGKVLSEDRKRIFRDLRKPVVIPEQPTKFKVKPTGRNNKVVGAGLMKPVEDPISFKPDLNIWKKGDRKYNESSSQEKKNQVLELVGASEHHWTTLTERSDRARQEKVNEAMALEFDREMEMLYEKYKKKETKVDKVIQSIRTTSLDKSKIKPVYPDQPPPETVDGYHPKYGQKYKHDKLDPHSAEFMPKTGNPVIDLNIDKATDHEKKARKVKILRKPSEMT